MKKLLMLMLSVGQFSALVALSPQHYQALYQAYKLDLAEAQKARGNKKIGLLQDAQMALNVLYTYTKQVHGDYAAVTQVLHQNGQRVENFATDASALQAELAALNQQIETQKEQLEMVRQKEVVEKNQAAHAQAMAIKSARKVREARVDAVAEAVANRRDRAQIQAAELRDTQHAQAMTDVQTTLNNIAPEPVVKNSVQAGRQYDQQVLEAQRDAGSLKLAKSLQDWQNSAV
jgi:hypothetical protein